MATIEYKRFIALTTPPKGERRLKEERMGFNGVEQVNLYIDTNGPNCLRFIITSGVYLEQTYQREFTSMSSAIFQMRNIALAWLRNTPRFGGMTETALYDYDESERQAKPSAFPAYAVSEPLWSNP